jgi:ABC-type phosphate/phosphonate transport system substrate-binding protein
MSRKSTAAHRVLTLAGAAAIALSLAACSSESSGDAGSAEVTNLTVGSAPSLAGVGLQVAISQVATCKDNLNVTSTVNKSANDSVPQLLSGGLQVAQMDTITFLQAQSQGLPVQIIAANAEQSTDGEPGQLSSASVVTTTRPASTPSSGSSWTTATWTSTRRWCGTCTATGTRSRVRSSGSPGTLRKRRFASGGRPWHSTT